MASVHVLGVRHHGPGSARSVAAALAELRPDAVLIEGPADAGPLLKLAAAEGMTPPVALLAYAVDNPAHSAFWPFAVFSPEWHTDTVASLARQMYESREFGAMPILADALQDAGCDSDHVLNHCRDAEATHVRGCWVVDALLGKT